MGLDVQVQRRLKGFTLDVSLSASGGVLGLLGASGSGKSMTLRCIAGIDHPDCGRIALDEQMLYHSEQRINLRPWQRQVGYLFQSYALFPHMTVSENIGCALKRNERKARIHELLERFQLQGLEDRYPRQLSGGQAQRVALARCLAAEPKVLLLDEPFSALDMQLRDQMHTELRDMLRSYPGQVVLVTHDQREAYRLCSDLAVMDAGQCIVRGKTGQLFAQAGLEQVARLTGCRNISRAKRLGDHRVMALDFGIELVTSEPVPEAVRAVGIRESALMPATRGDLDNCFAARCMEQMEEIDAVAVYALLSDEPNAKGLWARLPKGGNLPEALHIAPESVQVLL